MIFLLGDGNRNYYVVEAFLPYWSCYVWSIGSQDDVNLYLFPLAFLIVKGEQFVLNECVNNVV